MEYETMSPPGSPTKQSGES